MVAVVKKKNEEEEFDEIHSTTDRLIDSIFFFFSI
jgi:hypothetical protein